MNKKLVKQIIAAVTDQLGADYETAELHSDYIDNAAYRVSEDFGISEDEVRFVSGLPR